MLCIRTLLLRSGACVLALIGTMPVQAKTDITDLGRLLNVTSTNQYFPVSGFHRATVNLRQDGKPALLFIGAQGEYYNSISAERWPLVKALRQFGILRGAKALDSHCISAPQAPGGESCSLPTYDLSGARYTSPYLAFINRDLIRVAGGKLKSFQKLSGRETAIFNRYAKFRGTPTCYRNTDADHPIPYACNGYVNIVDATIGNTSDTRTLPLIGVGNYLQTLSQVINGGQLQHMVPVTAPPGAAAGSLAEAKAFPFATVQTALLAAKNPTGGVHVVEAVNAEANIITAIICRATRLRPKQVCGHPAIQRVLKHVH